MFYCVFIVSKLDPIPIFCFQLWFYPWYNSNLWNVWSSRVHQLTWNLFWINWVSIVSFSRAQTHTCACAQTYTHTFSFFHFPFMGEWVGHILKDLFERFLFVCCIGFSWIICFSKLKSLSINIFFLGCCRLFDVFRYFHSWWWEWSFPTQGKQEAKEQFSWCCPCVCARQEQASWYCYLFYSIANMHTLLDFLLNGR